LLKIIIYLYKPDIKKKWFQECNFGFSSQSIYMTEKFTKGLCNTQKQPNWADTTEILDCWCTNITGDFLNNDFLNQVKQ